MEDVFFNPWIGENYWDGGNFDKKILVIGNSHYCEYRDSCSNCGVDGNCFDYDECSEFTTDVVNTYLYHSHWKKWMNTYQKFERALCGYTTNDDDARDIWNSIAFYNYLQTAVSDWTDRGNDDDYYSSEDAFWDVIENLHPDYIIMWGNRVWEMAPAFNNSDEDCYQLDDGTEIPVLKIHHPSWKYFQWADENSIIRDFFDNN